MNALYRKSGRGLFYFHQKTDKQESFYRKQGETYEKRTGKDISAAWTGRKTL